MGVILDILSVVFGGNRNVLRETVEVFRENAEAGAVRGHNSQMAALQQLQAEFNLQQRGGFDRVMDGVNRLPRPALALGTLALMVSAMADPVWFAARMQGIALVPDPLWWLLGVIVSFYFGARQQAKSQGFQRDIALSLSRVPQVVENLVALRSIGADGYGVAAAEGSTEDQKEAVQPEGNPALQQWQAQRDR